MNPRVLVSTSVEYRTHSRLQRACSHALAPALLLGVVAAVWCLHYGKFDAASWAVPVQYAGDGMEVLARMKAAAEGDWGPFAPDQISRLGAPFGADWRVYPEADLVVYWLAGALARGIGLYPTANLVLLGAHLLAGLSFFGVVRMLGMRREWAVAGGVLFACSYFLFFRGLSHLALTLAWTVPPALASCWLVARGNRLCARHRMALLLMAMCLGMGSPYYLLLYGQLLVLALVWQAVSTRRRRNLVLGTACLAVAGVTAVLQMGRRWSAQLDTVSAPAIVRDYRGTELYSLKLVEMLVPPPTHRADTMRLLARRYDRSSLWKSESPSPYLGLAGIGGVLVLLVTALVRAARGRPRPPPGVVWQAGWIVLFSVAGGLSNFAALVTRVHHFRATNRFSVFLLAIALVVLTGWLARTTRRWPRWAGASLAALLVAVGLWDQVPPANPARQAEIAAEVASDRALAAELESRLPAGAALFQLPVMPFPEARVANRMRDYEHFRLYLNSNHLRFSYGGFQRRARGQWQSDYERLPAGRLAERLQEAGFAGISVNRAAYRDRGEQLLRALAAAGWRQRIEGPAGLQAVVLLEPARAPQTPLAEDLTFGSGWSSLPLDEGVRGQTAERGVFTYFNPRPYPIRARLRLRLTAVGQGDAMLFVNGRERWHARVGGEPTDVAVERIVLPPGRTAIELTAVDGRAGAVEWIRVHELDWAVADVVANSALRDRRGDSLREE